MKIKNLNSESVCSILLRMAGSYLPFLFLLFSTAVVAQTHLNSQKEASIAEAGLKTIAQDTVKVLQLLRLSEWYCINNNTNKSIKYTNQALQLSRQLHFDKGVASCDLEFSRLEQQRKNYEKAFLFANKAVNGLLPLKDYDRLGEAYVMVWSTSTLLEKPIEDRMELLKKASEAFTLAGNNLRTADCLRELGDIYQYYGRAGEAFVVLKRAEVLLKGAKNIKMFGLYDLIGTTCLQINDYRHAVYYGLLAVKDAEKFGEKGLSLCTIYNRLSENYCSVHQWDSALDCIEKSFVIACEYNDPLSIYITFCNKTYLLIILKKYAEAKEFMQKTIKSHPEIVPYDDQGAIPACFFQIYNKLGEKKLAAENGKKLLEALNRPSQASGIKLKICRIFIKHFINEKNIEKASYYTDIYTDLTKRHDYTSESVAGIYIWRFKIDSLAGNYLSAIRNYQRYKKDMDAISIEQNRAAANQFRIIYETEKKDRNILNLKKTERQQQSRLTYESKMRTIIIVALALGIVILILVIAGFYEKQKSNRLLKKKQDEINAKNNSLQNLVREKEWLLLEIHHRVKNNLHMVVGLLASQTEFIKDEEALQVIADSQHRVQAMSIIHQKLYQTETLSHVDMPDYIRELSEYLKSSFDGNCDIKLELDIDQLAFPLSYSIPIGLIINEALTNSIKYAFPETNDCRIMISLKNTQDNLFLLKIADNGIGMPEDFDLENSNSLGMRLIHGLSHDIHATLSLSNENGTTITIAFEMTDNEIQTIAS